MSPVHRAARPALLLLAGVLLLGACGIPTTGVVGSGEPATGIRSTTTLYFTGEDGLVAVPAGSPSGPTSRRPYGCCSRARPDPN